MAFTSLPASRWSLWREGDYLAHLSQGTWECWCWVGSAVPRQVSCPQEPEYDPLYLPPVSLPPPPRHQLDLLQLPLSSPSSSSPLLPSPPWDRLSSTWQALAWITGIPGQVSLLRKVSSACVCVCMWGREGERGRKSENEREGSLWCSVTYWEQTSKQAHHGCGELGRALCSKVLFSNPMNK